MSPTEKLAREICWLGFTSPRTKKRLGHTKAAYWRSLTLTKRQEYYQKANFFRWLCSELPREMVQP